MPQPVIRERALLLRAAGDRARARFLQSQVGATRPVLVESGRGGRTPQFAEMGLADPWPVGAVVTAAIGGQDGERLAA